MGSVPAQRLPTLAPDSHKVVARGTAHAIDAKYGMDAGLVACADYSDSLTMDRLSRDASLVRSDNRQSEVSRPLLALDPSDEDGSRHEQVSIKPDSKT